MKIPIIGARETKEVTVVELGQTPYRTVKVKCGLCPGWITITRAMMRGEVDVACESGMIGDQPCTFVLGRIQPEVKHGV